MGLSEEGALILWGTSKLAIEVLRDYSDSLEKIYLVFSLVIYLNRGSKYI